MQRTQQYRVRLPLELAHQVQSLAEVWNVPLARVLRLCVELTMEDSGRLYEVLGQRYSSAPDGTTTEQHERGNAYLATLPPPDWGKMVREVID